MTEKFSWTQCTQFAALASAYLDRSKNKETKLGYAISRVLSRVQKEQPKISEALADIDIDHCVTGDKDVIVRDAQGNLQYTKENLKLRNMERNKYLNGGNVEIEPYFTTKLPDDLNVFEVEALAGFVIKPEDAQRLLREMENEPDVAPSPNGYRAESHVAVSAA